MANYNSLDSFDPNAPDTGDEGYSPEDDAWDPTDASTPESSDMRDQEELPKRDGSY